MSESALKKKERLTLPVVSLGSEFLVIGHLMRRNIFAYKAPTNQEGCDIICIHPDPRKVTKQIRVQVKSRYRSNGAWGFPIKEKHLDSFDYLIFVKLNIGNFYSKRKTGTSSKTGRRDVEFYTFTPEQVRQFHKKEGKEGKWEKANIRKISLDQYKNENGFELIAQDLGIDYPDRIEEV
jgi:hypothetical protein